MAERDLRLTSEDLKLPPRPIRYASRSEEALSRLFEKYIPGWQCREGVTFQIPIGNKTIDFEVGGDLVEYHPIMINRELKSSRANSLFRSMYKRLNRFEREQLTELLTNELAAQYEHRRGQIVALSDQHRGKDLIVCTGLWDVYRDVIRRHAPEPPQFHKFKSEFYSDVKRIRYTG